MYYYYYKIYATALKFVIICHIIIVMLTDQLNMLHHNYYTDTPVNSISICFLELSHQCSDGNRRKF